MLPLRFFGNRRYSVAIGSLAMVLFALLGMFFLVTQYLQFFLGFNPLRTGLAIGPLALVLLVAAPTSVVLVPRRIGTKWVVAGGHAVHRRRAGGCSHARRSTTPTARRCPGSPWWGWASGSPSPR